MDRSSDTPPDTPDESDATRPDALGRESILTRLGVGTFQLDADGYLVGVNDAATKLTGYGWEDLVGKHVSRLLNPETIAHGQSVIQDHLFTDSRDVLALTLPVQTADGDIVPCEIRMTTVTTDGTFEGTVGTVQKVADPERAATIHDESERQQAFDALARASADGIIMLDDRSVIRYANPAVERILGYSSTELVGSSKMKIIPNHLRQAHADALERYLQTGEKHIDWTYVELPGRHADGREVPLAISINEFEYEGEHYFVGTFRDISKRKRAEHELRRKNDRLETFASMLAHELRNPLEIAQIYLQFTDADSPEAVEEVERALDRIEEMIDVLLVLARGSDAINDHEAVALADAAADAWSNVEAEGATLVTETDQSIRANPVHLEHLLKNLFQNAVEHSSTRSRAKRDDAVEHSSTSNRPSDDDAVEHSSTRSRAKRDDAVEHSSTGNQPPDDDAGEDEGKTLTIRVGDFENGFYVADDGPGIPEAEREKVFEAGFTTGANGTGLGLTFVAQLADAYGWGCAIEESEAGGARLEFTTGE